MRRGASSGTSFLLTLLLVPRFTVQLAVAGFHDAQCTLLIPNRLHSSYVLPWLRMAEVAGYRAAGLLPYRMVCEAQ